jgi:hypothetical protein
MKVETFPQSVTVELKTPDTIHAWKLKSMDQAHDLVEECEGWGTLSDLEVEDDYIAVPGYEDWNEWRVGEWLIWYESSHVDYHTVVSQKDFDRLFVTVPQEET